MYFLPLLISINVYTSFLESIIYCTCFIKNIHITIYVCILEGLPPLRWFISTFIPLCISVGGYTKRSLSLSGALLGKCSYRLPLSLNL